MTVDPIVPIQDAIPMALLPSSVFANFPEGSFLESVAIDAAGAIFITNHGTGEIIRLDETGASRSWARLDAPATGLAFDARGTLFCSGGKPGAAPGSIWRVDGEGRASRWLDIPDSAFLNGMTLAPDGRLLVVDSLSGRIFAVTTDVPGHAVWFADEALMPRGAESVFPGANGIKFLGGAAYVSNTDRATLNRIDLAVDGTPKTITIVAERLLLDDFAFDAEGTLYGASHAYNLLVRLSRDGRRATLAGVAEGIVNPTAVAFGRTSADARSIYVTTTGGVAAPVDGKLQAARVVRVAIGHMAAPLGVLG